MTSNTTPNTTMPPPPQAADPPMSRTEWAQLLTRLDAIERRSIRTETKVMRLLGHHGLDAHGQPLPSTEESTHE